MHRTTIMLPEELKIMAQHRSQEMGVSLGELIRECLETELDRKKRLAVDDPLFSDTAVFSGKAPSNVSLNHDDYLFEEHT